MRDELRWTGRVAALAGLALAVAMPASAAGLTLLRPRDGDTVREKVKVVIPASAVPRNGFASLFVDGIFHAAQAPAANSEKPLTFVWDTKAKLTDTTLPEEKRTVQDGEHVVEVRTHTDDGRLAERAAVNVRVNNRLPIRAGQPVYLGYRFKVGDSTKYAYTYDVKATGTQTAGATALPDINYKEFSKVAVVVEDVNEGVAFMRERRFSPVTVSYGDAAQAVPINESSRYFSAVANGNTLLTAAMEREKRIPFFGPLYLPARSVQVGASWRGPIMIWGGAFSSDPITLMATHTLEAMEWEHGVPTARIRSTYKGKQKLENGFANIASAQIEVSGTSIFHFAPSKGKVVRAVHELDGTLLMDTSQGTPGGTGGSPGYGSPGYGTPGYGGPPGGAPGYGTPGGAPGYGGPPGGAPGYGGPPGGAPGYGAPGGSGYGGAGSAPIYDPSANQGGPIPGVPVYATYGLKIRAVATVV